MTADRLLTILALAVLALTGLEPIAARAAGFDCKKATTRVERLVCADPALSGLDSELKRCVRPNRRRDVRPQRRTPIPDDRSGWPRGRHAGCERSAINAPISPA